MQTATLKRGSKIARVTQTAIDQYKVGKTYKDIHENTTLGEDVGTSLAYTR